MKEKASQLEHLSTQLSSKREPELNSLLEDVEASQSMQENMDLAKQLEKPMLGWLILNPRWRDFNVIFLSCLSCPVLCPMLLSTSLPQ